MMHHDTIAVFEYCRILKNLDDLNQSVVSTSAVQLECELYHRPNTMVFAKQAPFMFLNDISLGSKLQIAVSRAKIYINKKYKKYR